MPPHEPKTGPKTRHHSPDAEDTREPRLGLSFSQLVASALAAASAAFGASYLGVAGTIIGASVASVIATVASAMYASSLQRSTQVVRRTATQWTRVAATAPVVDPDAPVDGPADDTRELRIAPEPPASRRLPWARLSLAAAAVLALTLGAVTGVEGLLGKPLASVLGGSDATGTSLGSVGGSGGSAAKTRHDTTSPAPSGTPSTVPATTPAATPTGTPTASPTAEPTAPPATTPTTSPTVQPTTQPTAQPTPSPTGG
jgi:hypothetical protein